MMMKINLIIIVVICTLCLCHSSSANLSNTIKKAPQQYPQHGTGPNPSTNVTPAPSPSAQIGQARQKLHKRWKSQSLPSTTPTPSTVSQAPPSEEPKSSQAIPSPSSEPVIPHNINVLDQKFETPSSTAFPNNALKESSTEPFLPTPDSPQQNAQGDGTTISPPVNQRLAKGQKVTRLKNDLPPVPEASSPDESAKSLNYRQTEQPSAITTVAPKAVEGNGETIETKPSPVMDVVAPVEPQKIKKLAEIVVPKQEEEKKIVETAATTSLPTLLSSQPELNQFKDDEVDENDEDEDEDEDEIENESKDEKVNEEVDQEGLLFNRLEAIKDALVEKHEEEVEVTAPQPIKSILTDPPSPQSLTETPPESAPSSLVSEEIEQAHQSNDTIPVESPLVTQTETIAQTVADSLNHTDEESKVTEQIYKSTTPTSSDLPPVQPSVKPEADVKTMFNSSQHNKATTEVEEQPRQSNTSALNDLPTQQPSVQLTETEVKPIPDILQHKEETQKMAEDQPPPPPPPPIERPNYAKNNIGRGSLPSSRRHYTRPPPKQEYYLVEDTEDFEPYHDNEYHPVLASIEGQKSNEEVKRMMQYNEKDLLLDEAAPIPTPPTSSTMDNNKVNANETTTTTTSPDIDVVKMHDEQEEQVVTDSSRLLIDSFIATFLNDPTIIIYTLFCVFILSIFNLIKWLLRPKLVEAPVKQIKPPVEMLSSQEHSKVKIQLEQEVKMLKDKNLLLTRRIQRLPVIKGRKEVAEKLTKAKSQLAVLKQYNSVDQKNSELKKKMFLSKYNQVLIIQNFVQLEDLLELMRVIEFMSMSHSLKESAFAMKVECDFLREQMSLFRDLAKRFREDYKVLSNEIALEKKKETAIEEEYSNLKNLCDELDLNNSIDEWKRKLAAKESETDRYYKDYINNYYCTRTAIY